ncbi:hypothetical protein RhiirA4_477314 [Rhizophagus irregularis]|uniref:DDE Tnp4 domain-containing protein n=1 Tax=Rhizophagus irregularis TaxID=588596 RepID=A0A2I1HD17_9GLOM|nr:hypothetical protein RhiirA4_477314 [Rhizophagus irregularis]
MNKYTVFRTKIIPHSEVKALLSTISQPYMIPSFCSRFGIGEGTVILYTKRVIQAILAKKRGLLNGLLQKSVGLKNVIGAVDGTYIPIRNAPNKDPEAQYMHDARVYRNSSFYKDYSHLIQDDDYLLGDSAYPISPFLIPPFKDPSSRKHKKFNQFHSQDDDNDENDNYTLRNNDEVLKRTGQAKRNLIFHQHFS